MNAYLTVADYLILAAYLGLILTVGAVMARRERGTDDYFRAGRRAPWWAAGLSIFATATSPITFIGITGVVYATNWSFFLGVVSPLLVLPVVVRWYLPLFHRMDVTTAYQYLGRRFHRGVQWLGAGMFIAYHVSRTGIVLVMPSVALAEAGGIPLPVAIGLIGVLALAYTLIGGIEAVIWTDVLQVVVLLGGALAALGVAVAGLNGGAAELVRAGAGHGKFDMVNAGWGAGGYAWWVILFGWAITRFGDYTADQTHVQRYLTTRDRRAAARAIWLSVLGGIPVSLVFYLLGTALWVFYEGRPGLLPEGTRSDAVLPLFLAQQMPVGLKGLVIAGVIAAGMSTIDSSMNSIATVLVTDLRRGRGGDAERASSAGEAESGFGGVRKRGLRRARGMTLIVGLAMTGVALAIGAVAAGGTATLLERFLEVLGFFIGPMAGLFALGVFTRRGTAWGAATGAAVGFSAVVGAWWSGQVSFFLYTAIGLAGSVIAGYAVSLVGAGMHRAVDAEAD